MSTTILFCLPYHGHLNPCVPIVEELIERGERVLVFTIPRFRTMFERIGATFRSLPYEETQQGRALLTMVQWQLQVCEECVPALVQEARQEKVSYILSDYLCHWGHVVAQHLKLPLIVIHFSHPAAFAGISPIRSILMDLRAVPSLLFELPRFVRVDRRLARKWQVPRLGLPQRLVQRRAGCAHIVPMHEWMQPPDVDLTDRSTYSFVGPCIRAAGRTQGDELPAPNGCPLVYIALGTFWNRCADFYRLCVEAYERSRFQVLISAGLDFDISSLRKLPDNVHVRRHVDQISVLKRAAVFLSHGGMNSLCEAVEACVPLLLYPQAIDQFSLAEVMERRGLGVVLHREDCTAHGILSATERALRDPDMRRRLAEARSSSIGRNSAQRAADILLRAVKNSPLAADRGEYGLTTATSTRS